VAKPYKQYGALPFQWGSDGEPRVMLVTTRGRRRWMVPKGWPIPGMEPHETAAREALEEAGLIGHIHPQAIGSFEYVKRLSLGRRIKCTVEVFPLHVDHQKRFWLEQGERETKWLNLKKAASLVSEPTLRRVLLHFDPSRYPVSQSPDPGEILAKAPPWWSFIVPRR
jgi:8-oxo-dGTP pyrophosphatase MutT (NUDIX family)